MSSPFTFASQEFSVMNLRQELRPLPVSEATKEALKEHILLIEKAITEKSPKALFLIRTFAAATSREYEYGWFSSFRATTTIDEFVNEACQPPPKKVDNITRDELIEIVRRALPGDVNYDEEHAQFYVELFEAHVNMPSAGNLLYFPPSWDAQQLYWNPSPEKIVDIALSFLPEDAYIAM
jgi:hypothetical protein